jgi:tetratricopeptide (TPR) repeat protein
MGAMGQPPIHLTILRKGDTNIVDLDEVASLIPRSETQVDEIFLRELASEVVRLTAPGYGRGSGTEGETALGQGTGAVVQDLQRIGGLIFSHLLTEPARRRLRTAEPCDLYLRLDEQLVQVPWELCHDGEAFLATKFSMGRQVITGYPIPVTFSQRVVKRPLRMLLIADPTESLPEASAEAERLSTLLDEVPGVEVTLIGGKGTRKVPLLAALQDHEIVHFAGHSYYDPDNPSKSGWRLSEGVLTAGELSRLSHPPLLVFSNSCQAGATAGWESGYHYEGQAFGIGSAFLLARVRNYIGTFWVVHDEESALFAAAFYQGVVSGLSLGEALLTARHEVIRQRGWRSLTWASYMLYGDPAFTLLREEEQTPLTKITNTVPALKTPKNETALPSSVQEVAGRRQGKTRSRFMGVFILTALLGGLLSATYWLLSARLFPFSSTQRVQEEYEKAYASLRSGQKETALAAFQRMIADPTNSTGVGYDGLAVLSFEEGRLTEAQAAIDKALTANAANVMALLIQGDIAFSMGDKEQAISAYLRATQAESSPQWQKALAYNALGVVYALAGMEQKAQGYFSTAQVTEKNNAEASSNLGYLAWKAGNFQEAQQSFERVHALLPEDEVSREFSDRLSAKISTGETANLKAEVLIVPFIIGGGSLRRLGEGEVFAWKLARHLPRVTVLEQVSKSAVSEEKRGTLLQDPAVLISLAKERGAAYVVWGELQSFSHKVIVHGQFAKVANRQIQRFSYEQEGRNKRLATAAQAFAEKVSLLVRKK